jgi:DNA-binding transcriptional LysR family regulator
MKFMHASKNHTSTGAAASAHNLELRQLRAFVALVEQGSVTAASQALQLAQSTVSEALTALERALGVALVRRQRGTHAGLLSAAGEALLPHARDVLAAVDKTYVAVAEAAVRARGEIAIIANESVSTYVLSDVLAQLRLRWPNTQFSVSVATCPDVYPGVQNGTFDVGLLLESANQGSSRNVRSSRSTRFWNRQVVAQVVPLIIFAAPTHPLVNRGSRALVPRSALAEFSLFVSDAAGDFNALIQRFFREDRLPGPRLQQAGSIEGVKRGVMGDATGLGILPSYAIAEELRARRVVRLELRPVLPPMRLVALLSRSRAHHPSLDELLDKLRRVFAVAV